MFSRNIDFDEWTVSLRPDCTNIILALKELNMYVFIYLEKKMKTDMFKSRLKIAKIALV